MDTTGTKLPAASQVGPYEIRSHLGTGGMAAVYRAVHVSTGQEVALKVLGSSAGFPPQAASRFAREVEAICVVRHPRVVTIVEVGLTAIPPFIAMEYVRGHTLRAILERGRLSTSSVLRVGAHIAEGLAATHAAGIVHRDLKPENVMVTPDGSVKILDFGLSKSLRKRASSEDSLTLPGMILGTLSYMAPEQASGRRADFRADQFALGTILYEMATGTIAFQRETIPKTLGAIANAEPAGMATFRTSAAPELVAIVERALSKSANERFASMAEMESALVSALRRHRRSFIGRIVRRAASALRARRRKSGTSFSAPPSEGGHRTPDYAKGRKIA